MTQIVTKAGAGNVIAFEPVGHSILLIAANMKIENPADVLESARITVKHAK
jgi:hypothetical protein